MKVDFRQGILRYPYAGASQLFLIRTGSNIKLNTSNGTMVLNFAHGNANYLYTENVEVNNAWTGLPPTGVWIYWDLNKLTSERTFGFTAIPPVYNTSGIAPPAVLDQHWFDKSRNRMYVWNGTKWLETIRLFAGYTTASTILPQPPSSVLIPSGYTLMAASGVGSTPFAGTQVGINGSHDSGRILSTDTNSPVRNKVGEFLTIGTPFFVQGSRINALSMESQLIDAEAANIIPAFAVVKFLPNGKIDVVSYNDLGTTVIGIVGELINETEIAQVTIQGVITNPAWNWPTSGASLWVTTGGSLSTTDPNKVDSVQYPVPKLPVARVITPTSILFQQNVGNFSPDPISLQGILTVEEDGTLKLNDTRIIDFTGNVDVTVTASDKVVVNIPIPEIPSALTIKEENVEVGETDTLNFIGNVEVTQGGGQININVPVVQTGIDIDEDGVPVQSGATNINFLAPIQVTPNGDGVDVSVEIPSTLTVNDVSNVNTINVLGGITVSEIAPGVVELNSVGGRYDVHITIPYTPLPGDRILYMPLLEDFILQAGAPDSLGKLASFALISTPLVVQMKKNGTVFGTATCPVNSYDFVFTVNTDTTFTMGDVFSMDITDTIGSVDPYIDSFGITLRLVRP